ncbi:MAG: polymer-forming cytoskeletal protein [Pseudomonadota bacterium]
MTFASTQLFPRLARVWCALLLLSCANGQAATYALPNNVTSSPFTCTGSGGSYNCAHSISISKDNVISLNSDVTLNVAGSLTIAKNLTIITNGHSLSWVVSGNVQIDKSLNATMNITASGNVNIDKDASYTGNIVASGNITFAKDAEITGSLKGTNISISQGTIITGTVTASGTLTVASGSTIVGTCSGASSNYTCSAASGIDHVRLNHSGSGLSCSSPVTVYACAGSDSAGSCTADSHALSGFVTAFAGTVQLGRVSFSIAAGQGSTTVYMQASSAQATTLGVSSLSAPPTNTNTCWNGSSASCTFTFTAAGFLLSVPNHYAETSQTLSLKAVRKSTNSLECVPNFANTSKDVDFNCSYSNPTTGTLPVKLNGVALNAAASDTSACDATGQTLSLNFDSTGSTTVPFSYADVGGVTVTASQFDAGMTGSTTVIAAPKSFSIAASPSPGTIKAGVDFSTAVSALTSLGNIAPNFGAESVEQKPTFTHTLCKPNGGTVGTISAIPDWNTSVSPPQVTLNWSEVGNIDLTATLTNYLSTGFDASGNSGTGGTLCNNSGAGNIGRFTPDHFDIGIVQPGGYSYSGQGISVITLTAKNTNGTETKNYNQPGGFAKDFTMSATDLTNVSAAGTLSSVAGASTLFTTANSGAGSGASPVFTFTAPLTLPTKIRISAIDTDNVASTNSTAATPTDTAMIRKGRLRLSNAFGSAKSTLQVPVHADYWTGNSWALNTDDSTTVIPAASLAMIPGTATSGKTVQAAVTLANGQGYLVLGPANGWNGSLDLALNLGSTTMDASCLAAHAGNPSTGANLAWLRANNGSCATNNTSDPAGRASFGVYSQETKRTVHIREVTN